MKIRLLLATAFALSLGTSMYYTQKAPATTIAQPQFACCSGDPTTAGQPDAPATPSAPTPKPKPVTD